MPGVYDPIEHAHALRKQIDADIEAVKFFKENLVQVANGAGVSECVLAYRDLQMAKMWLGKVLEELGAPFPANLADKAPFPVEVTHPEK